MKYIVTLEYDNEIWVSLIKIKQRTENIENELRKKFVPTRFKIIKIEKEIEPFEEW